MIFLNSASSAAALVFYLPGVCTHTDTEEGKHRKTRVQNILKSLEKNTIFNEHPVPLIIITVGPLLTREPMNLEKLSPSDLVLKIGLKQSTAMKTTFLQI